MTSTSYLPLPYTFMASSRSTPAQVKLFHLNGAAKENSNGVTDETFSSSSLFEPVKQKAIAVFSKIVEGLRLFSNYITYLRNGPLDETGLDVEEAKAMTYPELYEMIADEYTKNHQTGVLSSLFRTFDCFSLFTRTKPADDRSDLASSLENPHKDLEIDLFDFDEMAIALTDEALDKELAAYASKTSNE